MAHFARLDEANIVTEVIVVNNEILINPPEEWRGVAWLNYFDKLRGLEPARWVQTSYNSKFRGVFAGIGMTYDEVNDIFVVPVVVEEEVIVND